MTGITLMMVAHLVRCEKVKEFKGNDALTFKIREVFKNFKEGRLDKEAHMKQVGDARLSLVFNS